MSAPEEGPAGAQARSHKKFGERQASRVTWFADLTPYSYFVDGSTGVLNVGWLDRRYPFPTGETSAEFRRKLGMLCQRDVNRTAGFFLCPFCPPGGIMHTGASEMRIGRNGQVYAAPTLIVHYVAAHQYRPPDEFIEAVLAWEEG